MSTNLLVWKWSEDYNTTGKRRKLKVKHTDVTSEFLKKEDSAAFGDFDHELFIQKVCEAYPMAPENRPFVIEKYERCLNFSIPNQSRFEVVPIIGNLAMQNGLNGTEC